MEFPHKKALLPAIVLFYGLSTNTLADTKQLDILQNVKQPWIASTLKLQREIDVDAPLNEATFIGTHNSYNSKSYATPLRYIDPNQLLSISEQLDMGIRSIELDAHWTTTSSLSKDILLCHAQDNHIGCSLFDRNITEGLQEIRDWLKANPNEIILLYIERHLDGHEPKLASLLKEYLGEFIYKASFVRKSGADTKNCVALPSTSLTKANILKAGKQLIIVTKTCSGASSQYKEQDTPNESWNDYVFAGIGDIPTLPYTFIDSTITNFTAYPDCSKSNLFYPDINHTSMWRIYEDRTNLSSVIHKEKQLLDDDMRELMRCGINWPTVDMLSAADSRLTAAIWSWARAFPQDDQGQCAISKINEGIKNTSCDKIMAGFACKEEKTHQIKALSIAGTWTNGETNCKLFAGKTWHFATPINGAQMTALNESMNGLSLQEVWLNYAADKKGHWVAK